MFASVRSRTTLVAALVTTAALVGGAIVLLATLHTSLLHADDALSKSRLRDLVALAADGSLPRQIDTGDGVVQVVDATGEVVAASTNITGQPALTRFKPPEDRPVVRAVVGPDDNEREHYRLWAQRAATPRGEVTVFSGSSTESVSEAVAAARRPLIVGLPVMVVVLVIAMWLLVGRALRPVEAIREEVAELTDRRLDRRVPVPGTDDEISRLATTMNAMLDRLEDASRRQRAFVADASHDLQSPLAAIRAELETHPAGVGDRASARRILAETAAMEGLVQNLLYLARIEDGDLAPRAPVDLDDVVLEEVARIRDSTSVRLTTQAVSGGPVLGNPADLRRLVRNLLENAVRHARSSVHLRLAAVDGMVEFDVHDDGSGVPPADRGRIFDRFYKSDESRERTAPGSGLGLPIARAIAEAHGGALTLADGDGGATFELRLPLLVVT